MCGIAGLIHRGKSSNVGEELQHMLQALKHRGPDSTGFALYGKGNNQGDYIMRILLSQVLYALMLEAYFVIQSLRLKIFLYG